MSTPSILHLVLPDSDLVNLLTKNGGNECAEQNKELRRKMGAVRSRQSSTPRAWNDAGSTELRLHSILKVRTVRRRLFAGIGLFSRVQRETAQILSGLSVSVFSRSSSGARRTCRVAPEPSSRLLYRVKRNCHTWTWTWTNLNP